MAKLTANKGAAEIRSKILRKMHSLELMCDQYGYEPLWQQLRIYIIGMATRASAKKGGLGRK